MAGESGAYAVPQPQPAQGQDVAMIVIILMIMLAILLRHLTGFTRAGARGAPTGWCVL